MFVLCFLVLVYPETKIIIQTSNLQKMRMYVFFTICIKTSLVDGTLWVSWRGVEPTTFGIGAALMTNVKFLNANMIEDYY